MAIRKIKLFSSVVTQQAGSFEVNDEQLKALVVQSLWRPGVARVNHKPWNVERRKLLDGFEYRMTSSGNALPESLIECYQPTEYLDWRDG